MKVHYLIHTPLEGPGVINDWANSNGHTLSSTWSYKEESLPDVSQFDFLIVMGGPQSACELEKYDYLQKEVELIRKAIDRDKYVLGICLGAQLIGEALGAKAERSPEKEMGCFPVELTEAARQDRVFKDFPQKFSTLHWHFDMPGIPEGAELLARSEGCPRQAIRFSDRIYGLQFHLEFDEQRAKVLIEKGMPTLQKSTYTQTENEILTCDFGSINHYMRLFLEKFIH